MIKPPAEKSLSSLTFIYVVGNFASKAISFVLVFVITFYLSREAVGEYDLIFSTLALLTPFLNLQLNDAILRWLLEEKNNDTISKVWTSSFVIVTLVVVCFTPIYFLICLWLNIQYYTIIYFLIVVTTFLPLFQMMARGMNQGLTFVLSGIIYSIIFTSFAILSLAMLNMKVEGLIISAFFACLFTILFLEIKVKSRNFFDKGLIDKNLVFQLSNYSLPLLPNTLSWWAISTANRFIILAFLGVAANGIFAISFKIPTLLLMLTGFFYMAWQEKAIKTFNDYNRDIYFTKVLEKYIKLLLSTVLILIAANKIILGYVVSDTFFDAWKYTPLLLISVIFQSLSQFYGVGYLTSKNTKGAFTTSVFGGIITIFSSMIFIPIFNLQGAALSIMLGYMMMFIVRVIQTNKFFKIEFPYKICCVMFPIIIISALLNFIDVFLISLGNILVALIISLIINLYLIQTTLVTIKQKIDSGFTSFKTALVTKYKNY